MRANLILMIVAGALCIENQCLFSQTPTGQLKSTTAHRPKTTTPTLGRAFSSLTILVDKQRAGTIREKIPRGAEQLTNFLSADGSFQSLDDFLLPESPLSVSRAIESSGHHQGDVVVHLIADDFVDFNSVAKAVLSLKGVEKKFESTRIIINLTSKDKQVTDGKGNTNTDPKQGTEKKNEGTAD